jgi:hypothetical protein
MTRVEINKKKRIITVEKERSTAVILAVFFGFWAWLYTYKLDSGKFWAGLIISAFSWVLLFIPLIVVWIWSIVDMASKDRDMFVNYSKWTRK